jgi:hypothetical protein
MKRKYFVSICFVIALLGCSTNETQDEPTYLQMDGNLSAYFSNMDGLGDQYKTNCDTIYNGTQYLINLYPYASYAKNETKNDGLVTSVLYSLNGNTIANGSVFPFSVSYTPNLQPGKYTLSVKPTLKEFVIWEAKETTVIVWNR